MHGRTGAVVDYYRTLTGPGKLDSYQDPSSGGEVQVLRVERIVEWITCRDCWALPAVQSLLKAIRSSGEIPQDP